MKPTVDESLSVFGHCTSCGGSTLGAERCVKCDVKRRWRKRTCNGCGAEMRDDSCPFCDEAYR